MNVEGSMELASTQAQVQVSMQKKSLDITADLTSTLIEGGTAAADQTRAMNAQGKGLNINAVA